jgi:hypothetical protein
MLGKTLTQAKGPVTHSVFNMAQTPPAEAAPANAEGEDGTVAAPKAQTDILDTFKHVYVPEVVREP